MYRLLVLRYGCHPSEIRRAYYKMSQVWHRDKSGRNDPHSQTRMCWINAAYKILSNPGAREFWDRRILRIHPDWKIRDELATAMDDRDRLRENLQKVMEDTRGVASDEAMRAAHDRLSAAVEARIDGYFSIGAMEPGST